MADIVGVFFGPSVAERVEQPCSATDVIQHERDIRLSRTHWVLKVLVRALGHRLFHLVLLFNLGRLATGCLGQLFEDRTYLVEIGDKVLVVGQGGDLGKSKKRFF